MFLDLLTNPMVILFGLAIIITILMFVFVGNKKKVKKKKVEKVYDKNQTQESQTNDVESETKNSGESTEKIKDEKNIDGFDYVADDDEKSKEKKVSKVYVRKNQEVLREETQEDSKYQNLSDRAEFVKTSKHVSKLSSFKSEEDSVVKEELIQEFEEEIKNCDTCADLKTRFDRSRRLSKSVKDDNFDNMFASHITDHYLNINPEKHVSEKIEDDIFKRANELVQNGETRALDAESQVEYNNLKTDKEKLRFWLEHSQKKTIAEENVDENLEEVKEDFRISLRNLVLTESLLKRKGRK